MVTLSEAPMIKSTQNLLLLNLDFLWAEFNYRIQQLLMELMTITNPSDTDDQKYSENHSNDREKQS